MLKTNVLTIPASLATSSGQVTRKTGLVPTKGSPLLIQKPSVARANPLLFFGVLYPRPRLELVRGQEGRQPPFAGQAVGRRVEVDVLRLVGRGGQPCGPGGIVESPPQPWMAHPSVLDIRNKLCFFASCVQLQKSTQLMHQTEVFWAHKSELFKVPRTVGP